MEGESNFGGGDDGDDDELDHLAGGSMSPSDAGRRCRHPSQSFKECYLLALTVPLFLLLLYLSIEVGALTRPSAFSAAELRPRLAGGTRAAELRALYLLQNQQSELIRLWNRSLDSIPPNISTSFVEIRSALLDQIKLNKLIEQSLSLSRNVNDSVDESQIRVDSCKKIVPLSGRRTVEWKPRSNRFLFAVCISGQMSNHLICLQKHMFFAAILGRVLVLPSPRFDYDYGRVVDIENMNKCFGSNVVITFDEFLRLKKNQHLRIDRFICYVAQPVCYLDDDHWKKLKSLGLSIGRVEAAWPKDGKPDQAKKRKLEDVMADDEVLGVGDLFFANVEEEWVMQPGGPLAHNCRSVFQPSRLIVLTAQRFIQTFLGGNFIALHFRRHSFLKFCNLKKESCFFPIPQAADCILRMVERVNAPVIYLSTDAAESETDLLQSLVVLNGKAVHLLEGQNTTLLRNGTPTCIDITLVEMIRWMLC